MCNYKRRREGEEEVGGLTAGRGRGSRGSRTGKEDMWGDRRNQAKEARSLRKAKGKAETTLTIPSTVKSNLPLRK